MSNDTTMAQPASKVYSYMRFSSEKQREGNSMERQTRYAATWAAEHGMTLDAKLTMRDEGLSAFHQKHVKTGALGVFLRSIERGVVAPGSVLVVEGLDRLSRAEPIHAQAQLTNIINAGITVVTASDGKAYSRESFKANPMDLIYSILVMIRANEESETKSRRVKAAFERQCQGWQNGTYRGRISTGVNPCWVRWVGEPATGKWELIEAGAVAIRRIVEMWLAGFSNRKIKREMTAAGLDFFASGQTDISDLIYERHHTFIGTRVMRVNGTEYRLENYYPAVIDRDTYNALVSSFQTRVRKQGRAAHVPCIFTGNNLFRCGYCGKYIAARCRRVECRNPDCITGSVIVTAMEKAVIDFCSDQMNLNSLTGRDQSSEIKNRLSASRVQVSTLERQLARLLDAMLATDSPPAAFAAKAKDIENQIAHLKHTIRGDEALMLANAVKPTGQAAEQYRALADAAMANDGDARVQVRGLLADTFSKISFYRYCAVPTQTPKKYQREQFWELLLVSKSGVSRLIRISRAGELLDLTDERHEAEAA